MSGKGSSMKRIALTAAAVLAAGLLLSDTASARGFGGGHGFRGGGFRGGHMGFRHGGFHRMGFHGGFRHHGQFGFRRGWGGGWGWGGGGLIGLLAGDYGYGGYGYGGYPGYAVSYAYPAYYPTSYGYGGRCGCW
jgi:hypothetical protein